MGHESWGWSANKAGGAGRSYAMKRMKRAGRRALPECSASKIRGIRERDGYLSKAPYPSLGVSLVTITRVRAH